jgi:O-antigen ligase
VDFPLPSTPEKSNVFHGLRIPKSVILSNKMPFFGSRIRLFSMRMARYRTPLFLSFLFLLPLQTVYLWREPIMGGEKWQYGTIGIYMTDLVLILIFGCYCVEYLARQWRRRNIEGPRRLRARLAGTQKPLFVMPFTCEQTAKKKALLAFQSVKQLLWKRSIFGIGFLFWAGLAIGWASDQVLAGYFFVKLLLATGAFFVARRLDARAVGWVVSLLFFGAVLQSLLGIGQFLAQSSFASTWLGMSGYEAWQAGASVLKNESGRWLRAYGTFPHPNILGGYLGVVLVLGVGYFSRRLLGVKARLLFWAGALVTLLGLLLTFSRTAWFGTLVGMLVLALLPLWPLLAQSSWNLALLKRVGETLMVRVLVMFCMATLIFSWVLHETVLPRFESRIIESEHSVSERVQSLEDAGGVIREKNSWLGVGGGNFTAALIQGEPERPLWSIQPVHNVFVLVLVELGVVGAVLFLLFLFSFVSSALKERDGISLAVFGVLFLSLCFDHWLWSSHFGLLFLFLGLGLMQSGRSTKETAARSSQMRETNT